MIVYTLILILVQTSFHPHGHHQVISITNINIVKKKKTPTNISETMFAYNYLIEWNGLILCWSQSVFWIFLLKATTIRSKYKKKNTMHSILRILA
jgi:hypothetical protein